MKRIVNVLLVSACLLVSCVLPARSSYAESPVPDLPVIQEDVAIFYQETHQLTAKLNSPTLTLDSEEVKAAPLLIKNGRLYFPMRWLETAHLGTVKWDAKTGSASVDFDVENPPVFFPYRVKPNHSKLYWDGEPLTEMDATIPTPFVQSGQLYIPVMLMPRMGINHSWSNGELNMWWTDKAIKVLQPELTTMDDTITFTALIDKYYIDHHIYLMQSWGIGGMTGGNAGNLKVTENVIGEPMMLDGKEYRRIEYTVDLRPGKNPLRIYSNLEVYAPLLVNREVEDPSTVPVGYVYPEEAWRITFTKPKQGYLRVHSGDPIELAGTVTVKHNPSTQITYQLSRFQNGDYEAVGKVTVIPLDENKKFSSSLTIQEPGNYLINIDTPNVPNVSRSKWGEIAVEVLPDPNARSTVSGGSNYSN